MLRFCLATVLFLSPALAAAQPPAARPSAARPSAARTERYTETVDVSLVNVELVVTDSAGQELDRLIAEAQGSHLAVCSPRLRYSRWTRDPLDATRRALREQSRLRSPALQKALEATRPRAS